MKQIFKSIEYKFKRFFVKVRQHRKLSHNNKILKTMLPEQIDVYEIVKDKCKRFPDSIRYDSDTTKILILLETMIITLHNKRIYIDNHRGFSEMWFSEDQYELIKEYVDAEAHRFRRKLQWEIRRNLRNFLKQIKED